MTRETTMSIILLKEWSNTKTPIDLYHCFVIMNFVVTLRVGV